MCRPRVFQSKINLFAGNLGEDSRSKLNRNLLDREVPAATFAIEFR